MSTASVIQQASTSCRERTSTTQHEGAMRAGIASEAAPLHLFLRVDRWLLALDALYVERVVDGAEITAGVADSDGLCRLTAIGGVWAGWDLAHLVGVVPQAEAWVLLRCQSSGRRLFLALGASACLSVTRLPLIICKPLPHGLVPGRPGMMHGLFSTRGLGTRLARVAPTGMRLDLNGLLRDADLERAAGVAA